jgi:hypothetical protein
MDRILYGEAHFYQGVLIQCQSYHDDYVCFYGGVAMSGSDGMDSSTQVHVVRCTWVPKAVSCHATHSMLLSPEDPTLVALPDTENPQVGLTRAQVHSKTIYVEDLLWANRWSNSVCSCLS